jgi:hypothetical protein
MPFLIRSLLFNVKKKYLILMLLKIKLGLVLLLLVSQLPAQDLKGLLPADNEIAGWKMADQPAIYEGDNLFELIDGGADLYLEYGFARVISAHYSDPMLTSLQAEIYEMKNPESAYGIFGITRLGSDWLYHPGNLAALEDSYISLWKGRYFVTISYTSGSNYRQDVLTEFATVIAAKIPDEGDCPAIVEKFRGLSLDNKPVFLEGNLALSNFYYFDYKNIFQISEAAAGSGQNFHWIIITYPDSAKAMSVVTDANQKMAANKRFSDVAMAFQGFSCRDNKGNAILVRQIGNYIAILVGLDPEIQLVPLMDSISSKIENERQD